MIQEVIRLVEERLEAARLAPPSACRDCAVEELEEVLEIIGECQDLFGEA